MKKPDLTLSDPASFFPDNLTQEQLARAETIFFKELSYNAHKFYSGKIMTIPKMGFYGINWFNVWYTPGVSKVSTSIRDNNDLSFELTNRGNLVAVVSDSTRVLGDGDCTPPGGLGVMEGKAFLMKYLGGVDAVALCINSYNKKGEHDPDKIIDFVKMVEPSFGAVNLEDISQPNCYKVLDTLREECSIPVWHDDAQGTACVTLAGLINSLRVTGKDIGKIKIVLFGAGAANTSIARLILQAGADPCRMVMYDSRGGLNRKREDIKSKPEYYRKWELCEATNPDNIADIESGMKDADVLIALSKPGPDVVKPEWIRKMAKKSIVFACSNPVPEIYPFAAKEAGAYIVATGRGDFPNQINNSIGFPGILKGALMVRARKITDGMAVKAAHSIADFEEKRGITPDNIMPKMDETAVFAEVAADVAMEAIREGVSIDRPERSQVYAKTLYDIKETRETMDFLMDHDFIKKLDIGIIEDAVKKALDAVLK